MSDERISDDALIDEVREIRSRIVEEAGHDVSRLCSQLRDLQRRYADRVAPLSPRPVLDAARSGERAE